MKLSPFRSRTDQSTSASACPAPGERRTLLLSFLLLFSLILVPRIPRLETYLLVTSKRSLSLAPASQAWRQSSEQALAQIETRLRTPSQLLDQAATRMAEAINQRLETVNCPGPQVQAYAEARLAKQPPGNSTFERRCQAPIDRLLQRERDLLGLTDDGRIRLLSSDTVLLAGDSLMQGPAPQISSRLRRHGIRPINASRVSTGLAYPQFFNWPARIQQAIKRGEVDAVIVFLGANDTFDMYEGARVVPLGTPAWNELYASRITAIASVAKQHKVALLWLGMPAMNRRDIQPSVPVMNRLFSDSVQRYGGLFLRTDQVLGETDKAYTSTKLVDGRPVLTRSEDGVHFTPQGWYMVADAVMKRISLE
ncbi:MAG: hypothetical protein ACK587_00115 [Cyanobacteriota bacterium]